MNEKEPVISLDLMNKANELYINFIKEKKYEDLLKSMSTLNSYSFNNNILILSQKPDATLVNGMHAWNYLKRNIVKGEKSIKIIAPVYEPSEDDPKIKKFTGFKVEHVYDIAQTSGRDVIDFNFTNDDFSKYFETIKQSLEELPKGFTINYDSLDGQESVTDFEGKQITIDSKLAEKDKINNLIKSISSVLIKSRYAKNFKGLTSEDVENIDNVMEESTYIVIANRLKMEYEPKTIKAVARYSKEKIEKFKHNLEKIRSVSFQVLSKVESSINNQKYNESIKEQETESEEM